VVDDHKREKWDWRKKGRKKKRKNFTDKNGKPAIISETIKNRAKGSTRKFS